MEQMKSPRTIELSGEQKAIFKAAIDCLHVISERNFSIKQAYKTLKRATDLIELQQFRFGSPEEPD